MESFETPLFANYFFCDKSHFGQTFNLLEEALEEAKKLLGKDAYGWGVINKITTFQLKHSMDYTPVKNGLFNGVTYRPLTEEDKDSDYIIAIDKSGNIIKCVYDGKGKTTWQWLGHDYPDTYHLEKQNPVLVLEFDKEEVSNVLKTVKCSHEELVKRHQVSVLKQAIDNETLSDELRNTLSFILKERFSDYVEPTK